MSVCVSSGDSGYSTLHAKWVKEGSPWGSFDELGEFGGRMWRVRRDDSGEPQFLLCAAAGPTDPGLNKDAENWDWGAQTTGFLVEMRDTGLEIEEGVDEGDVKISFEPWPRDETVWEA